MRYVVTGAGQIGTQLVARLREDAAEVIVVRPSGAPVPGARVIRGDAGDGALMARLLDGADGVFHTVHARYDPGAWRRELPFRELAVMDAAAEHGVPVVFPESVYAFGHAAEDLAEGAALDPCSPLGEVRAELLAARAAHPARTLSIVASDLVGPTASAAASVPTATVVRPVLAGRTAWVLADPGVPHAVTDLRDLADAMVRAPHLDPAAADRVLLAPTREAVSLTELAQMVARRAGVADVRVRVVPGLAVRAAGLVMPLARSLSQQSYLWNRPCVLRPGMLTDEGHGPRAWDQVLDGAIAGARRTPSTELRNTGVGQ